MEYRFTAEEWKALSPQERAHRCRLLANEARELARHASMSMQPGYIELATQWDKLADDMMREAEHQPGERPWNAERLGAFPPNDQGK